MILLILIKSLHSYPGYYPNFQYLATQPVVVGWSIPGDLNNGFIAPDAYTTSDIICHVGATNAQTSATVSAGGSVELQWTAWPESHHGPVIGMSYSKKNCCLANSSRLSRELQW